MKKYILLLYFLFLMSLLSFGQTSTHITSGTISTPTVWNGYDTYYVDTYITITTGGSLTIDPLSGSSYPVKVIFTSPSYGITIERSASLTVNGTSSRNVIFNADVNDNGTHDSGETWMNLSFDGSSGTSLINYAVIEYGTSDSYDYGGGIDIYGDNITVRNSIIRHCSCFFDGGGIYEFGNNITLENLIIHDNTASEFGGGIGVDGSVTLTGCTIYNNSAPTGDGIFVTASSTITNCSVYGHTAGEGVYINAAGTSIINSLVYGNTTGVYFASSGSVVNCDVVNNGTGVNSVSGTAPVLLNTAIWGNTSIQYTGANIALANCGIQGGFTTGTNGGGNVNLNSSNIADTGPNFVDPASDFHINSWITRLVDGGTASYSGVSAPANDMEGHPILATKDIGAYEFFYYLWTGATSTDWSASSNWAGSPLSVPVSFSENKVSIPKACANYPVASSLTLTNRSTVIIDPLGSLTVTGTTTVNSGCTFYINADATGSANFKTGSSVTGTFNTQLFLTGGGDPNFNWHYVCPPVSNYPKSVLTTDIGNSYNLLNYIENRVSGGDRNTGWNWHDTYNSTTPGFNNLFSNLGYNVYVTSDKTALFTGTILNEQDLTFSSSDLTYSGGTSDPNGIYGWNLIGNPFTCSVDAAGFSFGANIDPTIYFTKNNIYCSYNVVTHQSLNGATNFIPAMQGFFVHATNGSARTLTIPASSRTNLSYRLYYKGAKESFDYPLVKFNVSNGSGSDEALIYFFKDAVSGFDRNYDTYKMFAENPALPQIYTVSNNIKLGMNGLPFPDKITEVPLKLKIAEAKDYTINILDLENLDDYNVTLVHGDKRTDLKANPVYSFYATAGVIDNMSIIFSDIKAGISEINPSAEQTSCWYTEGTINIKTGLSGFENNSLINIFDLNGKLVYSENNISIPRGEINSLHVNLAKGVYVVSISHNGLKVTKKVVITY